jgi:hypothetical protein
MRKVFEILRGWLYPRTKNPAYEAAATKAFWMFAGIILVVMLIAWFAR